MRLLVVAHISYAPCGVGKTQVECKHLAEGWSGAEGCGHTVVIVVATVEYLVIRLSIVGREHQSEEWGRSLVMQDKWKVGTCSGMHRYASCMTCTSNGIVKTYSWFYVKRKACIGRIVTIACVVYKSDVCRCCSTSKHTQRTTPKTDSPFVQQRIAECIIACHLAAIARTVVGISNVALVLKLVNPGCRVVLATRVR